MSEPVEPVDDAAAHEGEVDVDARDARVRAGQSDRHERHSRGGGHGETAVIHVDVHEHDPVHESGVDEPCELLPAVLLGQQEGFVAVESCLSEEVKEVGEVVRVAGRIVNGRAQGHEVGPRRAGGVFAGRGHVADLPRRGEDPASRGRGDGSFPRHHVRDGADRHAGLARHVLDSDHVLRSYPSLTVKPWLLPCSTSLACHALTPSISVPWPM